MVRLTDRPDMTLDGRKTTIQPTEKRDKVVELLSLKVFPFHLISVLFIRPLVI